MSDQFNEQISEFIDDEMSVEESEFFVRRLRKDATARRQYLRYQLIGAAIRGEHFHPAAGELGRRLGEAIARDETAVRSKSTARLAAGAGIAASVALVAVFGIRFAYLGSDAAIVGSSSDDPAGLLDAPAYTVPAGEAGVAPLVRVGGEVTGIQYLIHHARYTSGISRTIMQSSVVASPETDPTDDSEEDPID